MIPEGETVKVPWFEVPLTIKSIDLESFSQISVIVDPETEKIKSGLSSGLIVTLKKII